MRHRTHIQTEDLLMGHIFQHHQRTNLQLRQHTTLQRNNVTTTNVGQPQPQRVPSARAPRPLRLCGHHPHPQRNRSRRCRRNLRSVRELQGCRHHAQEVALDHRGRIHPPGERRTARQTSFPQQDWRTPRSGWIAHRLGLLLVSHVQRLRQPCVDPEDQALAPR